MEVTDFDYDLPKELIAQTPIEPRDASRLLVMDKKTGALEHRHFYNLPEYLRPGDVLVFNDTRVMPARLHGTKTTGAHVEVFCLREKQYGLGSPCETREKTPGRGGNHLQ